METKKNMNKIVPLHGNSIVVEFDINVIRENINILSGLKKHASAVLEYLKQDNTDFDFADIIKLYEAGEDSVASNQDHGYIIKHAKIYNMAVEMMVNMVFVNRQWVNVLNKYKDVPVDENIFNQLNEEGKEKMLAQLDEVVDAQKETELEPIRKSMFGYFDNITDIVMYLSGVLLLNDTIENKNKVRKKIFQKYFNLSEKSTPTTVISKLVDMINDIVSIVK